ncbi:MAG: FtsX-like permease family protein, partial [Gemmatimonadaceae bacterium]
FAQIGSGTGANREHRRRYGVMVIAQIGFALPVLIGAVVLLKSSWRYASKDYLIRELYGYDPSPIVTASLPPPPRRGSEVRLASVASQVIAIGKSVPGVLDAAVIAYQEPERRRVTVDDANGVLRDEAAYGWSYRLVSPSYLRVYGHRIERGRDFADSEFDGNSVIMDARTAKFLWGNENPIGRVIKFGNAQSRQPWHVVVGIAGDQRDTNAIRRSDPNANFRLNAVYRVIMPSDSLGHPDGSRRAGGVRLVRGRIAMYLRVQGNTELAAVRLQRALRGYTAGVEPTVVPMVEDLGITFWRRRSEFAASLFTTFAFIGLGLVAIGVYGIVSHSVEERRRELGVRIALGATARDILHSVLREGNVLILSGVAVGLLLIKSTVGWLSGFIAEGYSYDALLFAGIAAALFAIAAFSAFVPAWRATRIDPVEALRSE